MLPDAQANAAEDDMAQCLQWVTDAYNEFLIHGVLSHERVNHLQMVYDKLRSSEDVAQGNDFQTMSNLTEMMGNSVSTGMQIPSLLNMNITPPVSISAIPTIGSAEQNMLTPTPTVTSRHHEQRSRSHSVEKPLPLASDFADEDRLVHSKSHKQSPDSHASSGLANSVTMEFGSDNGQDPYSPFDSPFSLLDGKLPHPASHDGQLSQFGLGGVSTREPFMKDHSPAGAPVSSSPFHLPTNGTGRLKPPPVLLPQDILATRISDELALVEVLLRIQFELASIGDLPAEDATTASEITATGGPSTASEEVSPEQLSTTTTAVSADSLLGNAISLPALPSPSSLRGLIATPPSSTPCSQGQVLTALSAVVSQASVTPSQSGNILLLAAALKHKMPSTPPVVSTSAPSVTTSVSSTAAVVTVSAPSSAPVVSASATKPTTSAVPKLSSSSQQKPTVKTSSELQKPNNQTDTKSDDASKSASKDGNKKVCRTCCWLPDDDRLPIPKMTYYVSVGR